MIYLAADHGGFWMKQRLAAWLETLGVPVRDLGPHKLVKNDDYPVWAARTARLLQRNPKAKAILLCRSGVGMAIVANKFPRVRAVQGVNPKVAEHSRRDENTNVLSLAADFLTWVEAKRIVKAWLGTPYRPNLRFERRLREIARIEHGG